MKDRTKLPEPLIKKSLNGELWLTAEEAVKYKVADVLLSDSKVQDLLELYETSKIHKRRK